MITEFYDYTEPRDWYHHWSGRLRQTYLWNPKPETFALIQANTIGWASKRDTQNRRVR